MSVLIRTLVCALLGALSGAAAIRWAEEMLRKRRREFSLSYRGRCLLSLAAAVPGGFTGYFTESRASSLLTLALLTVCLAVTLTDWQCRLIPNPTVMAVFALKLLSGLLAALHLPGVPPFAVTQSLLGMAACFALFFAPGLMGKNVGAGDVKLAAAMGFLLGFQNALLAVVIMGLGVIAYSLLQRRMPLVSFLKTDIPMGPFIAAGLMATYMIPAMPL